MHKVIMLSLVIIWPQFAQADISYYYPESFLVDTSTKENGALKKSISNVLSVPHQKHEGERDTLGCSGGGDCYKRITLGYNSAKKILFGQLHLEKDQNGYFIEEVYCKKKITSKSNVGPNQIPRNNVINCEHTWPQSKFSNSSSKNQQKSDLHHLYPTDTTANSSRGNFEFTEVAPDLEKEVRDCDDASVRERGTNRFMPPEEHRGNTARALFYFSINYNIKISHDEEEVLRMWAKEDPVDDSEMRRNEEIYKVQNNRNPFIDFPELYTRISDF